MNQSALISIIIGGTVAKQVQPLSLPDASSVNIQMQGLLFASIQASMHPPMPDTACHNHIILTFSKCCSSHLRPGALTCIESHDCVLFPQLDRNSVTGLTAVSARTISWGFVDASLLLAAIHTCTHPPMPNAAFHNQFFGVFSKVQLITSALICIEFHDSVSFPQLDCNSATGLTAVSARNIWCGFVDVRLITRCNTDL